MVRPAKNRSLTSSALRAVVLGQLVQRFVQGDEIDVRARGRQLRVVQFDALELSAGLGDSACGGRCSTRMRRMASAAAAKKWPRLFQCWAVSHVHQPQVRLVDQGGGLERLARLLLGQLLGRQLAQLVVDQRQQLLGGVRVALLDGGQDARNFTHRRHLRARRPRQDGWTTSRGSAPEYTSREGPSAQLFRAGPPGARAVNPHSSLLPGPRTRGPRPPGRMGILPFSHFSVSFLKGWRTKPRLEARRVSEGWLKRFPRLRVGLPARRHALVLSASPKVCAHVPSLRGSLMPKRTDLKKILLIGSGPIVIGQACEFDYCGTQACKALREEGYDGRPGQLQPGHHHDRSGDGRPHLHRADHLGSRRQDHREGTARRPAADARRPDRPQHGDGPAPHGVLEKFERRDDRRQRRRHRQGRGPREVQGGDAQDRPRGAARAAWPARWPRPRRSATQVGLPCVLRPSFTLGGTGGGIAYNREEFNELIARGLDLSPVGEVLIEESVIGWKEFELEVMRDRADNVVIVCSIENLDPMGVHTGDSHHRGPGPDADRQGISADARRRHRHHPRDRRRDRRQQHPVRHQSGQRPHDRHRDEPARVSRSSALASKATGFPIAKIAAKLAVGYRLDELRNDITRETPACFEPTIDYVVTKMPRWTFEKFPDADPTLTTQMKSVGETMAIGRTFKESLQKALRGLETGRFGLGCDRADRWGTPQQPTIDEIVAKLATPNAERIWYIRYAFKAGMSRRGHPPAHEDRSAGSCTTSARSSTMEERLRGLPPSLERRPSDDAAAGGEAVRLLRPPAGAPLAHHRDARSAALRKARGVVPVVQAASTPAPPSSRRTRRTTTRPTKRRRHVESDVAGDRRTVAVSPRSAARNGIEDETRPPSGKDRIMILGGGPNRIGQGIEFDYCCCQAAFALREAGYETIMVNSNPETVSTDYDTSDHLFFEPLTAEDVLNICDRMQPNGLIVQFGGQTPLNLAQALEAAGAPIIGTSVDSIDIAEDRERFQELVERLGLQAAGQRHRPGLAAGRPRRPPHRLSRCWSGPATSWAAGPWRSSTTRRR